MRCIGGNLTELKRRERKSGVRRERKKKTGWGTIREELKREKRRGDEGRGDEGREKEKKYEEMKGGGK